MKFCSVIYAVRVSRKTVQNHAVY